MKARTDEENDPDRQRRAGEDEAASGALRKGEKAGPHGSHVAVLDRRTGYLVWDASRVVQRSSRSVALLVIGRDDLLEGVSQQLVVPLSQEFCEVVLDVGRRSLR